MSTPRLSERPSFAQRDAYRDVLSDGFAQGRLVDEDFDVRLQLVHEADRLSDLESLISDLPRGDLPVPVGSTGGTGSDDGAGTTSMPVLSRGSKVLALVLVGIPLVAGVCLGAVTGAARIAQQPASDAGIMGVVDTAESEVLEYRDVARGVEFVAQQDAPTTVRMSPGMVHLEVPTEDGTAYDSVVLPARCTQTRRHRHWSMRTTWMRTSSPRSCWPRRRCTRSTWARRPCRSIV
jgi:hypothetical protein